MDKGTLKEKTPIDILLQQQQEQIDGLAKIADLLTKAEGSTLQRKWLIANPGETLQMPFVGVKSLYVDNTNNTDSARIRIDGEPGVHLVPAGCANYIPCDGVRMLSSEGSGICFILVTNLTTQPNSINSKVNSIANLAANKPAASMSNIGVTYWSVDTDPHATAIEVSNGVTWTVI